jgi:thiol-disulfide isomerase/thioredoxin
MAEPTPDQTQPTSSTSPRNRRHWLAVSAMAAGAGTLGALLWQRQQPQPSLPAPAIATDPDAPYPDQLPDTFWQLSYARPDGQVLSLSSFKGKPLVINFWATWCPPCVKELPLLDQFAKQMAPQGWRVLGLASDQLAAVQQFLQQAPVGFDVAMSDADGINLAKQLGNTSGGLPFSVVIDAQGRVRTRKMGAIREADFSQWVSAVSAV